MKPILVTLTSKIFILFIAILILIIFMFLSMAIGQYHTDLTSIFDAIFHYDSSNTDHLIIIGARLSRTLISIIVGGSLALAGSLMQALTRNPLASPSLFGVNAGALFFVVCATIINPAISLTSLIFIAFIGAIIASILVFVLSSTGGNKLSPMKLVLSGTAISALFVSFTQGFLVVDEQSLEGVLFWIGGSVSGRDIQNVKSIIPIVVIAAFISFIMSHSINLLLTGDDIAKGLGQNVVLIKVIMGILIIILAGSSVATAGSIGFIGLIVPHIVKKVVGLNYRWIVPYSIIFGGILLILADLIARVVVIPEEMPIGIVTAIIGAPFFIILIRNGGNSVEKH